MVHIAKRYDRIQLVRSLKMVMRIGLVFIIMY